MIVKNLLVVGVVAGFASAASADGEKANWGISGKIRMDAVQSTTDTTPQGGTKTTAKSSEIKLKRAQFKLLGERGGDKLELKYYAESNTLQVATISHKFTDMVNVSFGKMDVLAQSWETDYSSTDQYLMSWAGLASPDQANGAQVELNFGDHTVNLQVVQGVSSFGKDDDKTTFNKSGGLSSAIQYRGEINKMIRPLITYTMVRPSSSAGTNTQTDKAGKETKTAMNYGNGYQTQLGAGVQVEAGGATVDLEYDTVKNIKAKVPTGLKDTTTNSIVAQVRYPVGMTTPFFKLTSDTIKKGANNNIGDQSGLGMALGVEHKLDANCRLHAVYTNQNAKSKASTAGDDKVVASGFNLGVTASM